MFEPEHKLRHLPFFEAMASSDEGDVEWHAASAGLLVLRLVDAWIEDGPRAVAEDGWALRSVRIAIAELDARQKLRTILSGILDVVESTNVVDMSKLASRMMAYGQLLEYDARWTLAADVYNSIVAHAHPTQESDVATQAHLRRGFCLRQTGNIAGSLLAYETAGEIARTANDMVGVLRARIGEAKAAIVRGNMPQAQVILDETIATASQNQLDGVRSMALHDRAGVAIEVGDYELGIRFAYDALTITESARDKDRILADIAVAFFKLGMRSAARDANLILAATCQEQYQRWVATLNLMEIAAADGETLLFEQYRRSIDAASLPPQLEAIYWLHSGVGYALVGESELARTNLERALRIAEEYSVNKVGFDADEALSGIGASVPRTAKAKSQVQDVIVLEVADQLRLEREEMGV